VTSRAGQITEVVQDGYSELLIEPGNIDELTRSIIQLLNDSALRFRLGVNTRNEAVAKYSWWAHAGKLVQIFFSVLAAQAPSRQWSSVATT